MKKEVKHDSRMIPAGSDQALWLRFPCGDQIQLAENPFEFSQRRSGSAERIDPFNSAREGGE